jgi:hypothetical protein
MLKIQKMCNFFLRSKQLENENNKKRMPLKDKPRELHQQGNRSLLDSSSDDGSSDNDQVTLFLSLAGIGL